MTNTVIFDMDGVLTDSEAVINEAAILGLRDFGVDAEPEDFLPFVGMGEDRYIGGVAEKYGKSYELEMKKHVYDIYLKILPGKLKPFPGVHELLHILRKRQVKLAVASSADRVKVEANLKALDIRFDWFETIIVGEDVEKKKPAPDIYLETACRLEVAPVNCCVVEDALSGVTAAKSAGMRCVAVEESFAAEQLYKAGADIVRTAIRDITLADIGIE